MKANFFFVAALLCTSVAAAKEAVDYIDPFIGTGAQGKTWPGAATPNGMVQLSPDTITGGDFTSGYRYRDETIQGFSMARMSGVGWYGDLGNFLVMPTTGKLQTYYGETGKPGTGYLSLVDKASETASAGYYAVTFVDTGIHTELTATPHSGFLRFTFPQNPLSRIQIDLARRIGGTSLRQLVEVKDKYAIEGEIECTPKGGGRGHGAGGIQYTIYFHAEFSKPLNHYGVWSAQLPAGPYNDILQNPAFIDACRNAEVLPGCGKKEGRHLGFYTEFPTTTNEVVLLKVGISFISISGARTNLMAEIPGWDFDRIHQSARQSWADVVNRVQIDGGSETQRGAFYTAMYHSFMEPQIFADVSGEYPGGDGRAHAPATNFTKRTTFAGWDVYRSEYPLLTLIAPEIVNDMISSMTELAAENGKEYYDRWEFLNRYQGNMNGNPAVVVLNDAFQKGIRNYDTARAFRYAMITCEHSGNGERGFSSGTFGLSLTMENANADWNLAQLAKALGTTEEADKYANRASKAYHDSFDAKQPWTYDRAGKDVHPGWKGWFRPRDNAGNWAPWNGLTSERGAQEASIFQQGWLVPYDVPGLEQLLGGRELLVSKLNEFFERTPDFSEWNPYYNQPNEPCHLTPFLFNRAGAPWLTQKWVRKVDEVYRVGPNGLCGDEDNGQMSAWFILAASGLHQACPGDRRYEIFTPLFAKITIRLDPKFASGTTFTITAKNNCAENIYIQSATLNGKPLNRCWLDYGEITEGGALDLVLGPQPNKSWGGDRNP